MKACVVKKKVAVSANERDLPRHSSGNDRQRFIDDDDDDDDIVVTISFLNQLPLLLHIKNRHSNEIFLSGCCLVFFYVFFFHAQIKCEKGNKATKQSKCMREKIERERELS